MYMVEQEPKLPIFMIFDIQPTPEKLISKTMEKLREIAHENDIHVLLTEAWV